VYISHLDRRSSNSASLHPDIFTTAKECLVRLHDFVLSRDFAVVTRGSDKKIGTKPLAVKTPERLQPRPDITPALEPSPETSLELTELPASTAPIKMEQEHSRRSRKPNTLYANNQYEMAKR
jgi:hypothetical protein